MDELTLRRAEPADLDRIMDLEQLGFAAGNREDRAVYVQRLAAFPDGSLVACRGHEVVGCFFAEIWLHTARFESDQFALGHDILAHHEPLRGDTLYVSSMTIDPVLRGGGLGGWLFAECLGRVLGLYPQLRSVLLLVNEAWRPARAIYAAAGFEEVARLAGFFNPDGTLRQDGIVMRRPVLR